MKKLRDEELLAMFYAGDQSAMSALVDKHRKKVYNYIRMMVKDPDAAEDISQETFIKALQSLREKRYSDDGKFPAWIMRIAHNKVIDYFRREKVLNKVSCSREDYDLLNNSKFSDGTVEDKMISDQICADVRKLISQLPYEQKEVVTMRHYQNMSFKDIAEETGVSINTALGRMRYALLNLRKMIDENKLQLTDN